VCCRLSLFDVARQAAAAAAAAGHGRVISGMLLGGHTIEAVGRRAGQLAGGRQVFSTYCHVRLPPRKKGIVVSA